MLDCWPPTWPRRWAGPAANGGSGWGISWRCGHLGCGNGVGGSDGENCAAGEHPDDAGEESPCGFGSEHGPVDQRGQSYRESDPGEPARQHPQDEPDNCAGDYGDAEREHSEDEESVADSVWRLVCRGGMRQVVGGVLDADIDHVHRDEDGGGGGDDR